MKMNESRYVSSFESPQKNSRVVGFYQMQNTKSRRCSLVERSSAGASPCPCCRHRTSSQRPWRSAFCFQLEISMLSQCVAMLQSAGQDIFRLSLLCKQLTPGLEAMILFHLTREAFEVNTKWIQCGTNAFKMFEFVSMNLVFHFTEMDNWMWHSNLTSYCYRLGWMWKKSYKEWFASFSKSTARTLPLCRCTILQDLSSHASLALNRAWSR